VLEFSRSRLADRGVDLAVWDTCAGDETSDGYLRAAAEINRSMEIGGQFGISSTPGFFVNGYPVNGAKPGRVFEGLIERARQEAQE
jgi:protein-disulfide isomerase